MKQVNVTYHETTLPKEDSLAVVVEDDDQVIVLDSRTIANSETRWQFLIVSEQATRSRGDGYNS